MAQDTRADLVGRPHSTQRFAQGVGGALALVLGIALLARGTWPFGAPLVVLGLYGLSDLRRKATVTSDRLVVQGRVARREVSLADLVRVTLSPQSRLWVAAADGRSFHVRMVAEFADVKNPGVLDFVPALRERALAAGARLETEDTERSTAPRGTSPLVSA